MLSVNYGNFLKKSETAKANYEFNRPIISYIANSICIFCVTGAIVCGALYGYASLSKPNPTFSQDTFNSAQALNNNLSKGIATMKNARPDGINAMAVISKISENKPENVMIETIKVTPGHYTIKGTASLQETVNSYASSLDFGKGFQTAVTNVAFEKNTYAFTIESTYKTKAAPKAANNANGNAAATNTTTPSKEAK